MAYSLTSNRLLQKLLFLQLILIFFHLGIRYFIDSTLVRDAVLILAIIVYTLSQRTAEARDQVSSSTIWMICYGVVIMIVHSLTGDSALNAITQFRDFFLPLTIVPIYKTVFTDRHFRMKTVNLLFVLFAILLIDVYFEFFVRLLGFSRDFLPWYPYQYTHLYRFTTAPEPMPNAISPEQAPILGIFGWPLLTSAALMGLFAFLLPWIMADNSKSVELKFQKRLSRVKYLFIVVVAGAFLILEVKTSILAFLVILFIFFFKADRKALKSIMLITFFFVITAYLTKEFWIGVFESFADELAEGELDYILSFETMTSLFGAFISGSPIDFLFGADFSYLPHFENLEIRLLVFTLELGVIWLFLYCILISNVFKSGRYLLSKRQIEGADSLLVKGIQLSLIAYLIDMLHYANQMYSFNLFFFGVMLALISSLIIQSKNAQNISNYSRL